ncbi:MAG: hypothetical protein DWP94_10435 [Flavobacterium sp.]|nr:MAG: hypothetical protein DWP94_10435 [Flavobacterium sp.]
MTSKIFVLFLMFTGSIILGQEEKQGLQFHSASFSLGTVFGNDFSEDFGGSLSLDVAVNLGPNIIRGMVLTTIASFGILSDNPLGTVEYDLLY